LHGLSRWQRTISKRFDHSLVTFKLEGKHAGRACADCHAKPALLPISNPHLLNVLPAMPRMMPIKVNLARIAAPSQGKRLETRHL